MYLGLNYALDDEASDSYSVKIQGDVFDLFLEDKDLLKQDLDTYSKSFGTDSENISRNYNISSSFSKPFQQQAGSETQPASGSLSFLDVIKIIWAFFATLLNIFLVPITLFSISEIPPLIAIMIGFPLVAVSVVSLIIFIRGGGGS